MYKAPEALGQRLIKLRSLAMLRPSQVASKLKLTTRGYLLIEDGKASPDYFVVRRMMTVFDCTSDYILFGITLGLRKELLKRLTRVASKEEEDNAIHALSALK